MVAIGAVLFPEQITMENVRKFIDSLKSSYNEQQLSFPDEQNQNVFPMHAFGYQIHSTSLGFAQDSLGRRQINLQFTVHPIPYAFQSSIDDGVNEDACRAIAQDLRGFAFRSAPFPWQDRDKEKAAEKLISFWLNTGRDSPLDPKDYAAGFIVHLKRSAKSAPITCSTLLRNPS